MKKLNHKKQNFKLQVEKQHYDFNKYVDNNRWNSYYYQIESVCNLSVRENNILLVGVWDWIVSDILNKIGYNVTSFDFDEGLKPDIIWDVTKIDEIVQKKYDVVVCCQVLEHIPFEMFESTIKKISKITDNLVLSLPNKNFWIKWWTCCPILRNIIWKFSVRIFWQNMWDIHKD